MRILTITLPEAVADRIGNDDRVELATRAARDALEFGWTADFGLQSAPALEPMVKALAAALAEWALSYVLTDVSSEYRFAWTHAEPDYDGFGTLTMAGPDPDPEWPGRQRRIVAIRREAWTWQTTRYHSGMRAVAELTGAE